MEHVNRMSINTYLIVYAVAKMIYEAMPNKSHTYNWTPWAQDNGTLCQYCGYSLLFCTFNAKVCSDCDEEHAICTSSKSWDHDCYVCSEHCHADNCADCGDTAHSMCGRCGNGNYCCCCCQSCYNCGESTANACHNCSRCSDCCKCLSSSKACWRDVDLSDLAKPARANIEQVLESVDPVQSMADFYLAEWIMAYLPGSKVAADAARLQAGIVARCERAFMLYGPIALGGELRHHGHGLGQGSGRNASGRYFLALTQSAARGEQGFTPAALFRDAAAIFDDGSWSAGYGGTPWKDCAQVFAAYAEGKYGPKVFVDRCFALQHNGGSFLNKMGWKAGNFVVSSMLQIGEIHANAKVDADIAELTIDQYPAASYGGYCKCSACTGFTSPPAASASSAYCSPTAAELWSTYRTLQIPASRRAAEARRAAYYGTAWA